MKTLSLMAATAILFSAAAIAEAQVITTYRPTVTYYAAPTVTYYAPAAPTTTYYAPAATTTYYAQSSDCCGETVAPVTTYYAPSAPVTTYYAPATTVYSPVAAPVTAVTSGPVWVYDPTRILPRRRWRLVY